MNNANHKYGARAPVRIDPAGGGTDAPPFCTEYGGAVVNFGIQLHAYAFLEPNPTSKQVTIRSLDFTAEVSAPSVAELAIDGKLDLLKGVALRMAPPWGFTLTVESEVPPGSGLGSSGAVGVACVGAFDAAMGHPRSAAETAALANRIERQDLGYAGGSQDSYGAALGGINLLVYHQNGGEEPREIKVADRVRFELERRCLLVYTGEAHLSGSIHDDIKRSYALPNSPTVDAMKNLARIGRECATALESGDLDRFGALLSENWHHHQHLHASCTSPQLERYYQALTQEVVGGKTCGAGGGGCILFLTREGHRPAAEQKCLDLGGRLFPLRLDLAGLTTWQV